MLTGQFFLFLVFRLSTQCQSNTCCDDRELWSDAHKDNVSSRSFVRLFSFSPCSVDADEIKRLGKRFKKLDLDNSGSLSVEEFMSLPELQQNPLVQRVIDIFDTDGNGEVDFKGKPQTRPEGLMPGSQL